MRRLLRAVDTDDLQTTLALIRREFAYMSGVVDPPSSVLHLTIEDLTSWPRETWVIGSPPVACVVLTPKPDVLYIGKLAVAWSERGSGLSRMLLVQAEIRARELGVSWLELQTRIELTANHATFRALGFVETGRTSHPGYTRPTSITFRQTVHYG